MKTILFYCGLLLFSLLFCVSAHAQILVDHTCVDASIIPQVYLDTARGYDILFCHASVGGSIMAGMNNLASSDPVRYSIDTSTNDTASWFDSNNGIIDLDYGSDWMSGGKIPGFDNQVRNEGFGTRVNMAFMKFCYIDWNASTDADLVWTQYRDMMLGLESDYPGITFVWWTSAICNNHSSGDKMSTFNNNLRAYCAVNNKVVFDLAAIESHDPDGNMALDDFGYEAMYAAYAADGQHPGGPGRTRLANAMWWLFARIAGWNVEPTRIAAESTTDVLGANGTSMAVITARLYDNINDLYITTEERDITFGLTGPGTLTGPNPVTTARGTASIIYESGLTTGTAVITATSPGLVDGSASIDLIMNSPPDPPTGLRCDGMVDPLDIPRGYPELTWTFSDPDTGSGDRQIAYRLLIADSPADIAADNGNVWDTGKTLDGNSSSNPCSIVLTPFTTYYWKVKTWDVSDVEGPYSSTAVFKLSNGPCYGLSMDPVAGNVDFGNDSSLDLDTTDGITIEFWIFRTEENRESFILDKFTYGVGGYRIGIDASDHIYFRTTQFNRGDRRVTGFDTKIPAGKWHHVACCQTGDISTNDGIIYINGVNSGFNSLVNVPAGNTLNLNLHASGAVIDELRISNILRYTSDFTPPSAPFTPDINTVGLWHFDEGSGVTVNDFSSFLNTGVITPDHSWGASYFACAPGVPLPDYYTVIILLAGLSVLAGIYLRY